MLDSRELMLNAWRAGTVIPAFNIPYRPMMAPIVQALQDTACFGFIAVARLEWVKFEAGGLEEIYREYQLVKDERYTRLHLDHVPVIDEDNLSVDYEAIIADSLRIGYGSVMVDGSRLNLDENIAATRRIVDIARERGVPVEGELGAVMGHEEGPLPPYEELFSSGRGFTDPEEAKRFVEETGVDSLSVAIGNIHGAISEAKKSQKKVAARLNIERLDAICRAVNIPLVLHGGSGIRREHVLESFRHGIAKINVGTAIRQPYEGAIVASLLKAQEAVYEATVKLIREKLEIEGSAEIVNPAAS